MSKIYDILKNHIVENNIQYEDVIKFNSAIPKEIITSVKSIASENPEEVKLLTDKIKSLEKNERLCILSIIIDYSDEEEMMGYWRTLLVSFKKDIAHLSEIS